MLSETLMFWAVLAGLLCIDNFVLLPAGMDYLRLTTRGRWSYEPGLRVQVLRRDLIFLNPLNPFDRLVQTDNAIGRLTPQAIRTAKRLVRCSLRYTNMLSMLGSVYLVVLAGLAAASIWLYIGDVLLMLAIIHMAIWIAAVTVLVTHHEALLLSRFRTASLAFEALVVPGYLVNIGKRVWYRRTLDLPAISIGLRQLNSMSLDFSRDFYAMQISRRLDELAILFDIERDPLATSSINEARDSSKNEEHIAGESSGNVTPSPNRSRRKEIQEWFKDARQCLATSVQGAGS